MFRTIDDVEKAWSHECESTARVLRALTDASLSQSVTEDHRTLGRIAWHLTVTVSEMLTRTDLAFDGPPDDAPVPATAAEIADTYEAATKAGLAAIRKSWKDESLLATDDMYGQTWKRGFTVQCLLNHQTHHRGQMTVLMRQAGLKVPGVYGPALEEWSNYGAPPPAV